MHVIAARYTEDVKSMLLISFLNFLHVSVEYAEPFVVAFEAVMGVSWPHVALFCAM